MSSGSGAPVCPTKQTDAINVSKNEETQIEGCRLKVGKERRKPIISEDR
jgi:hypothetical protein